MATTKTTQEYLNTKAGLSGYLRTKQEAMNLLAGTSGLTLQDATIAYATATAGSSIQQSLNKKVGQLGTNLITQDAASLL